MKDSDWQLIQALYQTQNITRAAAKLYLSQPTLTKRLQSIEQEFDVNMVERTSKGVIFTRQGELLAKRAEEYLQFLAETHSELDSMRENQRKVITVGAPYTYSRYVMTEIVFGFSQCYPEVCIEIVNAPSDLLFQKVLNGEVDAAFVRGDYTGNVVQRKVGECYAYLVSKEPVEVTQLPKLPRIQFESNDRSRMLLEQWWAEHYSEPPKRGMTAGRYLDVACQMAAKGLGYVCCFIPEQYQMPQGVTLTPITKLDGTPVSRTTWLTYQRRTEQPDCLQALIRFIEGQMGAKEA